MVSGKCVRTKGNKMDNIKLKPIPVYSQCNTVMFAQFVCALLNFHACEFLAKSETQEPMKISWTAPRIPRDILCRSSPEMLPGIWRAKIRIVLTSRFFNILEIPKNQSWTKDKWYLFNWGQTMVFHAVVHAIYDQIN